jgi:hypothetical protein
LNLPRKKGTLKQKANVSHGKIKMDNMVIGESPCVRGPRSLYIVRVVRGGVLMSMERKKVMRKQRRSKEEVLNVK